MDEECVEELGRPISSLKVSELRDELAKRALIKTGKKNELIDRLRQAICKHSTSIQQQSIDVLPTDLTVQATPTEQVDEAIDYSAPQTQPASMTASQHQVITAEEDVVSSPTENLMRTDQIDEHSVSEKIETTNSMMTSGDFPEAKTPIEPSEQSTSGKLDGKREENTILGEQKETSPSNENRSIEGIIESESHEGDLLKKSDDQILTTATIEDAQEIDSKTNVENNNEISKDERIEEAPVVFTLKRGSRENSSSNRQEKRRKWSAKSEANQSNDPALVSGGISSQKLQELIDLREQKKVVESKKETKKSSNDEKPEVKKDNQTEKTATISKDIDTNSLDNKSNINTDETIKEKSTSNATIDEKTLEPTNWLVIKNLTRLFKIDQLKEELSRFGPIIEEKFWIDKVKSKCCVLFESIDAAKKTKDNMQGLHWPESNPKSLIVHFITEEIYKDLIENDNKPPQAAKSAESKKNPINGQNDMSSKKVSDRLSDRLDEVEQSGRSIRSRLGDKVADDATNVDANRSDLKDSQPKELDEFFRKTKVKPQLFWLPLDEEQAEARKDSREVRDRRAQEAAKNAAKSSKKSPQQATRKRSPPRRSPVKHISPIKRRSPIRRRTPPPSRRSPARRRPPLSPRESSPPRRRSPSIGRRTTARKSPPPPPIRRRSPQRNSPLLRRRTPVRDSPPPHPPRRRSPSPLLRRRSPLRDSPLIRRRSPEPKKRSPVGYGRRSPVMMRRSPGPIRRVSPGRRSPGPVRRLSPGRRSPGMRSPGPMRRSPGPMRRSPGLLRRSPGPVRRSPGPIRRSPGPIRRSPGMIRRSPNPMRRSPGPIRRSRGARDYD